MVAWQTSVKRIRANGSHWVDLQIRFVLTEFSRSRCQVFSPTAIV
jgi:hypothetical protein